MEETNPMVTLDETMTILDPRAEAADSDRGNGPDVGPLKGRTIGLKTDEFWYSWDWVAEEWARLLEADGARTVTWREPMPQGVSTPLSVEDFDQFANEVDAIVTGLANCGSCTFVAVRGGMAGLERGFPTVFVATEHFERLARVLTGESGWSDIRMTILPYPLEGLPEQEIRQIARDAYPMLLQSMGAIV
jgi:hypothetical protein